MDSTASGKQTTVVCQRDYDFVCLYLGELHRKRQKKNKTPQHAFPKVRQWALMTSCVVRAKVCPIFVPQIYLLPPYQLLARR